MQWTERQKRAIEARGTGLLVSAAAGSGKTTVMVERILRMAMEGTPLDRMLVVTFTRAAASSMREKLNKELEKRLLETPQDVTLRKQSEALHRADISTYSAFLVNILRQYYYLLDIPADFKILDNPKLAKLQEEALDQTLEEGEDIPHIEELYHLLVKSGKDKALCDAIKSIYAHISIFPDPEGILEEMLEAYGRGGQLWVQAERKRFQDELICLKEDINELKELALTVGGKNNCVQIAQYDEELTDGLLGATDFEQMAALKPSPFMSLRIKDANGQMFRSGHEVIKKALKNIMEQAEEYSELFAFEDFDYLYLCMEALFELVRRFGENLYKLKLKEGGLHFSDIDHLAIKLLNNEQAAAELRNRYDYIFVDEYQDNNKLQEHILSGISHQNNIFYVGDVKQSIYRFRNADPSIFIKKERTFANGEGENVYLNNNFRSCGIILDAVNFIFTRIMKRETLGIEYDDNAALHPLDNSWQTALGREDCACGKECLKPACPAELMLLDCNEQEKSDELAEYKKQKLEALAVVKRVKEILREPIYDPEIKSCRMPRCRDIVILARSANELAGVYQEVFRNESIPLYTEPQAGLLSGYEAGVIINLLSLIAGAGTEEGLLSVLLSPIGGFDENELSDIRIAVKEGNFIWAMDKYIQLNPDSDLGRRLKEFNDKTEHWSFLSFVLPLEQFIWRIYEETGYFYYVSALPMGQVRAENLRQLARRGGQYMQGEGESLSGFLNYLEFSRRLGGDIEEGATLGEKDDVVRLMTIHKSKGLEFPICLLVNCGQSFNTSDARQNIQLDAELGIGVKMRRLDRKTGIFESRQTVARAAITAKKAEESRAEEARLLYVGMTRAVSRLILCGTVNQKSVFNGGKYAISHAKSFLDFIIPPILHHPDADALRERFPGVYQIGEGNKLNVNIRSLDWLKAEDGEQDENIMENILKQEGQRDISYLEKRFARKYAFDKAVSLRSKGGVTDLLGHKQRSFRRPSFVKDITSSGVGNLYHLAMERLKIKEDMSVNEITEQLNLLTDNGIFTKEERRIIKPEKLARFFTSEPGKKLVDAKINSRRIYREEPFCIWVEQEGEQVLVQGIIDCYFTEKSEGRERAVLIDYKTDSAGADSAQTAQKHKNQLGMYARAIRETLGLEVEGWLYLFSDSSAHRLI